MGGLGHIFEEAGVPTTQISLVREHTEQIQPPRALWVPFELGRPLGAPGDAPFQHRVLRATLELFEREAGPVLEDFPDDAPGVSDDAEGWACALQRGGADEESLPESFLAEFERMQTWYERAVSERGRTTYGASGLSPGELASFLGACHRGSTDAPATGADPTFAGMMKLASEELMVVYQEAATAQPGKRRASALEVANWFWGETQAGALLLELKGRFSASDDPAIQFLGNVLVVPANQTHRVA